jgi:hypothetical protein
MVSLESRPKTALRANLLETMAIWIDGSMPSEDATGGRPPRTMDRIGVST